MRNAAGSLGYQMMKALQTLFRPGTNRRQAKRHHREKGLITSISTMRCMSADGHQFARFICMTWPVVRLLAQVVPRSGRSPALPYPPLEHLNFIIPGGGFIFEVKMEPFLKFKKNTQSPFHFLSHSSHSFVVDLIPC